LTARTSRVAQQAPSTTNHHTNGTAFVECKTLAWHLTEHRFKTAWKLCPGSKLRTNFGISFNHFVTKRVDKSLLATIVEGPFSQPPNETTKIATGGE
jgi:hypothetical protein